MTRGWMSSDVGLTYQGQQSPLKKYSSEDLFLLPLTSIPHPSLLKIQNTGKNKLRDTLESVTDLKVLWCFFSVSFFFLLSPEGKCFLCIHSAFPRLSSSSSSSSLRVIVHHLNHTCTQENFLITCFSWFWSKALFPLNLNPQVTAFKTAHYFVCLREYFSQFPTYRAGHLEQKNCGHMQNMDKSLRLHSEERTGRSPKRVINSLITA